MKRCCLHCFEEKISVKGVRVGHEVSVKDDVVYDVLPCSCIVLMSGESVEASCVQD